MPWVKFHADFDFTPAARPTVTIAHKAGRHLNVTRECADKAVVAKRGVRTKPLTREEARSADDR